MRNGRIWAGLCAGVLACSGALVAMGPGAGGAAVDSALVLAASGPAGADRRVDFNKDVLPVLSDRCFKCHGPDEAARELTGGLRLDSFEGATADLGDGEQAIVPGEPAKSLVMQRLLEKDPKRRMPPPDSNLTISDHEIELIGRWIAQGAKYTPHWSFVAPVKPEVPEVGEAEWCRNEIDHFVLAELERQGIEHSPEADRETLIRRVSLDLTGLPPSPEEIDAFLKDDQPGAYERVVDRLLASPHYGERVAMMWLDVARYADTNGYHHDNERTQWPWRDWVIHAFNDNMPFDDFVVRQIGGDLMPGATREDVIATGFCRNHSMTDEGGAIDAEYLVEYAADRVETMSDAFLGLTMNCVRCHDHKYDPWTQEDYYSLMAFFDSIEEKGLYDLGQGLRDKAFPPFIKDPSPEQEKKLAAITAHIEAVQQKMSGPIAGLDEQQKAWEAKLRSEHAVSWAKAEVVSATSENGSTLTVEPDGSVLASGENPDQEVEHITLRTDGVGMRMIALEALGDKSLYMGRVGRAPNGNAVLSGIEAEAVSVADPTKSQAVALTYAWADVEQQNGDFDVMNALRADDPLGWAVDAHNVDGPRLALFLSDVPFGFEGGTELRVTLRYQSQYARHAFGRVKLLVGSGESLRAALPVVQRDWWMAAPFEAGNSTEAFETAYGPESVTRIDLSQRFGEKMVGWQHRPDIADGAVSAFDGESRAFYFGRSYFSPEPREVTLSLGSDDAIRVYLNGREVLKHFVLRGVAADQEKVRLELPAGESALVVKIVNQAGPAGIYSAWVDRDLGVAPVALLDEADRLEGDQRALQQGYRERLSPEYRAMREELAAAEKEKAEAEAEVPNVMVMKELPEPKATFVLTRGMYDQPDKDRPVSRRAPEMLGAWPEGAPRDRYGLGLWLVSDENPLTARVAVNRFWQMIFATGIVKTVEDFGIQGEWPSHPELLDWLAVDFREHGWDVKRLLRQIVTSSTYRQSSAWRADLAEIDPEDRLLARSPRYRLTAELVRDNALSAAGLLNERVGGPSVKPYQPEGLWEERSMPASNTRFFKRDSGEKLYRRGMYTFWKRSSPPPQMKNFDAPTRETCTARRSRTNTPLQALTLMNDETYLEIARVLAARVYRAVPEAGARRERLSLMFRLVTCREATEEELDVLEASYRLALERYERSPADAEALLSYGEMPVSESIDVPEHAAATVVANIVLNLDEAITRD